MSTYQGRSCTIFFLIAIGLFLQGANGITITGSCGIGGEGSTVSMNINALKDSAVNGQLLMSGSNIVPSIDMDGPIRSFSQTHQATDRSGKKAQVYVRVLNAPDGLTYSSEVSPQEGSLKSIQPWLSAEQWLTVPKADYIKCTATASYGKLSADVGIEESKGSTRGDYVTLTDYDGFAYASATKVEASQTAAGGSGKTIKLTNNAKDSSGTYSISTLIGSNGYSPWAEFAELDADSSAGTSTQVAQDEHIWGGFTSTAKSGTKSKTRTSNYGTEYDLNMQAKKGSTPTAALGYYVNPYMATPRRGAISGAVNAAQSGDTLNVAAGLYKEDVAINKALTLKGFGDPTVNSFTLANGAPLGAGSGGITAPKVTVNKNSRIQDGIDLVSENGHVNVAAGTYKENVVIDKSLLLQGAGAGNTIVDGNKGGSVFAIGLNNPNIDAGSAFAINSNLDITISGMTIQGGSGSDESITLGGGIYSKANTLNLNDVSITGNTGMHGGGILNYGNLFLDNCMISKNMAEYGGGIYNKGTVTMNDPCKISDNTALRGGGILNNGNILLYGGSITSNKAQYGGGILNTDGLVWMQGGSISDNIAEDYGGGIFSEGASDIVRIDDGTIGGNSADLGGGIFNLGIIKMYDGSISGNKASYGGGIYSLGSDSYGTIELNGGSILNNIADEKGGGIYSEQGEIIMESGVIISDNKASKGGGIYNLFRDYINPYPNYSDSGLITLNGGVISNNNAFYGGGIFNDGDYEGELKRATIKLNGEIVIKGNTAIYDGGGIYNTEKSAVYIDRGDIILNQAHSGGGIYNNGILTLDQYASVQGNQAIQGGGIFNAYEGTVDLNPAESIWNNNAEKGGGIYNEGIVNMEDTGFNGIAFNKAQEGAGVWNTGLFIMNHGIISTNTATGDGGGLYNAGIGTLFINGGKISDNTAYKGGGVYNAGNTGMDGVINCIITGNEAIDLGGGVYNSGSITITDSIISKNSAGNDPTSFIVHGGGGILNRGIATITNCDISENEASVGGGGIWNQASIAITDSTISSNSAGSDSPGGEGIGGGLMNSHSGTATLARSTISGNSAYWGGAIYNENGGPITISSSTISGNSASSGVISSKPGLIKFIDANGNFILWPSYDPSQVWGNYPSP